MVVEKQVPDTFTDGRLVVCDADMLDFGSNFGGGGRRVATRDLEGVAE